jgi:hypothetical protein
MYTFNHEKLEWELDIVKQEKYNLFFRATIGSIILIIILITHYKLDAQQQDNIIDSQLKEISTLKTNVFYLETKSQNSATEYSDFRKSLPITLTQDQEKRLHYLYFKYKHVIELHHVPANLVWYIAFKESNFKTTVQNNNSSAKGMFQFIDLTWNNMCKRGGLNTSGRNHEDKQVKVMCIYLDYLFDKYHDWKKVHEEYCGGVINYTLPYYK